MKYEDLIHGFIAIVISIITPAEFTYALLIGLWSTNYVVGLWTSKYVDKIGHRWAKSKEAIGELLIVALILFAISGIGFFQRVPINVIEFSCQTVGWVVAWVYLTNIVHNGRRLNPKSSILRMLENILKVEFIKRFKFIKEISEQDCTLDNTKKCDDCGVCIINEGKK